MLLLVITACLVLYTLWQLQPARMERMGPNAWVGMRSPATVSSAAAWRAAHRAAWPTARDGSLMALALLAIAAVVIVMAPSEHQWEIGAIGMGAGMTAMVVSMLNAYRKAERAAKAT